MLSFPVPVLSFLFVSFRPSLIRFPQLFLRCFPYALALGIFRFPSVSFRPLQFCLRLLSLCFFLSLSSRLRLTVASSVLRSRFRSCGLPRSLLPGFPCIPSRFRYSASLSVSFRPSSLRSHSCSTSACLLFRFRFSSGIFRSASASFRPLLLSFRLLSLLFLPFRSSRFCLSVASPVLPLRFRFLAFPVPPRLVSHPFSPGFRTRLSVGFLSSFPASLPQLFHR